MKDAGKIGMVLTLSAVLMSGCIEQESMDGEVLLIA